LYVHHFNRIKTQTFLKLYQPFTGQTFVSYETKTNTWEYKNIASSWLHDFRYMCYANYICFCFGKV